MTAILEAPTLEALRARLVDYFGGVQIDLLRTATPGEWYIVKPRGVVRGLIVRAAGGRYVCGRVK